MAAAASSSSGTDEGALAMLLVPRASDFERVAGTDPSLPRLQRVQGDHETKPFRAHPVHQGRLR